MRKTVTIPAAGKGKPVQLTGRSVIIESAGIYESGKQVPTFDFSAGRKGNPIYARSTFGNDGKEFDSLTIFGTAESAQDEVTFISVDECLQTDININTVQTTKKIVGQTVSYTLDDSAFSVPVFDLLRNNKKPTSIYLSARRFDANYGFVKGGHSPNQNEKWHRLPSGNEPIEIKGIDFINSIELTNKTAGNNAVIVITSEY